MRDSPQTYYEYVNSQFALLNEQILQDRDWRPLLKEIEDLICEFDKGVLERASLSDPNSENLTQFVKFCVPMAEAKEAVQSEITPNSAELASTLLWVRLWRPMDDLLDDEEGRIQHLASFTQKLSQAIRFSALHLDATDRILMTEPALKVIETILNDKDDDLRRDTGYIHKRSGLFETVAMLLGEDQLGFVDVYRHYINLIGFCHDVVDVVNDVRLGFSTVPQQSFKELNLDVAMSADGIGAFFREMREEVARLKTQIFTGERSMPYTRHSVEIQCRWIEDHCRNSRY